MSTYNDDGYPPPREPRDRQPYPNQMDDYGSDVRRSRPPRSDPGRGGDGPPASQLPPPPLGDGLRPAMKRAGSQSRVPPDTRPAFPDEASYLGGRAPDLEVKDRPRDRRFRDRRDGYESEEGETLRGPRPHRPPMEDRDVDPRRQRPRDQDRYPPDNPPSRRGPPAYDDDPPPHPRRRRDPYDDEPPPRRQRDAYDDDPPPRRRRGQPAGVEYGSAPIPTRRTSGRRPQTLRPHPRDYDDYSDDDDYRPRRRPRSHDDYERRPRRDDDRSSYADRERRRYDDPYDDRRRRDSSRNRRRYDDDDEDYDRRDRRDRDKRKPPKEIKIGNYDVGPWVEKGQKHYATLAPIVTPLVINYARKYLRSKSR